jgi:choline-glycine betaine transporter
MSKRELILLAASIWTVGLIGLLCEHFHMPALVIDSARTLFGVGTCTATGLVLVANGSHHPDPYQFTRWVTRWIYILTYMLALVRVALSFGETPVRTLDDFQFYVACCVLPLWAFRVLTPALVRYFVL